MSGTATYTKTILLSVVITLIGLQLTNLIAFAEPQIQPIAQTVLTFTQQDCLVETMAAASFCENEAEQLLASTVRLEVNNWLIWLDGVGYVNMFGRGHGTVKDGRYLVTHNHFASMTYDMYAEGELKEVANMTLHGADGAVLATLEGASIAIVEMTAEKLVVDFGEGFFDSLGVPSASFAARSVVAGDVVAQLNWNNERSHIEWAQVRSVQDVNGTVSLVLDNMVIEGASGGGIFLNGQHVANNWKYVVASNEAGEVVDSYSVGALNNG